MARLTSPLPLVLILLSLAPAAGAAGVNLSWDACTGEGGVQNKTFACDTNLGSRTLYGSFVMDSNMSDAIGIEVKVDVTAQADSLPAWWRFAGPNACRVALSASFSFVSDPNTSCADPWSSQATGAVAGYHTFWTTPQVPGGGPATARALLIAAVPHDLAQVLSARIEYYGFKLVLSSIKTVGTAACGGCATPVCVTLSEIKVVGSGNTIQTLSQAIVASTATWQSAGQCPGSLVPQNVTWGQIRSVLR